MKKLSISVIALLTLSLCFYSCQKEENSGSNVEYVKNIFAEKGITKFNLNIEKINSSEFDRVKFMDFVNSKIDPNKNYKIAPVLAILAYAAPSFNFSVSDGNGGSGGYTCTVSWGSETYTFYRGPAGTALFNVAQNSTWTTSSYGYNSSTNTHSYVGYDTYTIGGFGGWNTEYEITVRRVGTTCYFTRKELH